MSRKICESCGGTGLLIALDEPICCPDCCGLGYIEVEDEPELVACACGNTNLQVFHTVLNGWQVYCPKCGDKTDGDIDRDEAINWWNHLHTK